MLSATSDQNTCTQACGSGKTSQASTDFLGEPHVPCKQTLRGIPRPFTVSDPCAKLLSCSLIHAKHILESPHCTLLEPHNWEETYLGPDLFPSSVSSPAPAWTLSGHRIPFCGAPSLLPSPASATPAPEPPWLAAWPLASSQPLQEKRPQNAFPPHTPSSVHSWVIKSMNSAPFSLCHGSHKIQKRKRIVFMPSLKYNELLSGFAEWILIKWFLDTSSREIRVR